MSDTSILTQIDNDGRATLTMNRPELHNAFDDTLITGLIEKLRDLEDDPDVRFVILAASGKSFSAGADLNWMRRMADYSREQNLADAERLAELMRTLDTLSKPTIALVQGAAYGGGVGLVACCDIAIATARASFCLSEVKLGLIPAVISPYVVAAIGPRAARRYFLSAESFDAGEANRYGLDQPGDSLRRHAREPPRLLHGRLVQQPDRNGWQTRGLAQEGRERLLAALAGEAASEIGLGQIGAQIDAEHGNASRVDRVAQHGRERVDAAALDPRPRHDGLALDSHISECERDPFQRRAGKA